MRLLNLFFRAAKKGLVFGCYLSCMMPGKAATQMEKVWQRI